MKNPLYITKAKCAGCRACAEICPKSCISMIEDKEGFLYPQINEMECIDCQLCKKTCPLISSQLHSIIKSNVGVHTRENVFKSASGGAFWALCEMLIPMGYAVAGVKFTRDFQVVHDIAFTLEEAESFRKSKYVMSNTNGIYKKVKKLVKAGHKVMFAGTPCEVAACRKIVGDAPNFLLVDLVCHGAPNQRIFDKEILYLQAKYKGKVSFFEFRNKRSFGSGKVNSRSIRYVIEGKEYVSNLEKDPFLKGYYSRLFYRPSCMECQFANPQRVGDITLADAWNVKKKYPDLDDLSGVSLLLFNTVKGLALLPGLISKLHLREVPVNWAVSSNEQLQHPTISHENRDLFFELYKTTEFACAVKKATHKSLFVRIYNKFCRVVKYVTAHYFYGHE